MIHITRHVKAIAIAVVAAAVAVRAVRADDARVVCKMADDDNSSTSDDSLDFNSDKFDPIKALYSSKIRLPSAYAPIYDNVCMFESRMKNPTRVKKKSQTGSDVVKAKEYSKQRFISNQERSGGCSTACLGCAARQDVEPSATQPGDHPRAHIGLYSPPLSFLTVFTRREDEGGAPPARTFSRGRRTHLRLPNDDDDYEDDEDEDDDRNSDE
uniref:Uncharacterized protein n=1 Tax=Vespula pensylvanica TaxID=30213 RepID=A0A834KVD4_VESPE|nr:hypothetical protein H0235_012751 [Vespula pensylvanica]